MDLFNRREFLNRSALLSAAAATLATAPDSHADTKPVATRSVNDKLRVAVVGVNGRGMEHVGGYGNKNNCEITTICDCDEAVIGRAMKALETKQGKAPKYEKDIRKVVENKDIDIISIATPNHWHALMAIWGMENGKDVYVEKPATHNVREGSILTAVARNTKRICQVGTQSRSSRGMQEAIAFVQSGKIGKVDLSIGLCYKPRGSIGKVTKPTEPPKSMDYDLWSGPAPKVPVMRAKLHYDWHWIWNYGCGDLGNQGVHEMDKARWGLAKNTLPNSVFSVGGRFGYVDDGETANTQLSVFDYGDAKLIFEVRGLKTEDYKGAKIGNLFIGSDGYVVCPNYSSGIAYDKGGKKIAEFKGGGDHFDNFVKAVRSRKAEELNAPVRDGHLSAALCHLANISYRLGSEAPIGQAESIYTQKDVKEFSAGLVAHLKANKVEVEKVQGRFGIPMAIDVMSERFTGLGPMTKQANDMLFREYRKGFEVKEVV